MTNQLIALTLLSKQWQKLNKSYLENFVPLFATLIIKNKIQNFEKREFSELAKKFSQEYGLPLPTYIVGPIVNKFCEKKYFTKMKEKYVTNIELLIENGLLIEDEIEDTKNQYKVIIKDFCEFCRLEFSKEIDEDSAQRIIQNFIKENGTDIFMNKEFCIDSTNISLDEKYYINKYVSTLYLEKPDFYKIIVSMAVGNIALLAMYITPPGSLEKSLSKCVFYFDSSFIFPLLGIDLSERKIIIKELLADLISKGATIKIFKHTYNEIINILETATLYLESPDYDPKKANKALFFLRQEGYSKTQVELIIQSIDRVLEAEYIKVDSEEGKILGINEQLLFEEISKNLILKKFETAEFYKERTERDVNSIIFTYERRKKLVSKNFKDAKYSFITENGLLTSVDKKIIYELSDKKVKIDDFFPAAIHELILESYLFLGSSKKAIDNMNLSIFATAINAINPSKELQACVKEEAKKLLNSNQISEADFLLLNADYLIKDSLSKKTLCNLENISENTIYSLVEDAKEQIAIDERNKRKKAEEQLSKENNKNFQRIKKAKNRAKRKTNIIFVLSIFGLLIPYFLSAYSFFLFPIYIGIICFAIWTLFCFIINYCTDIKLKKLKSIIYEKQLKRAYDFFELDFEG